MKNATKAVIAGVAGIALLTGGAGSLAYWTDTKAGTPLSITAGNLALGTIADGSWTLQQNATGVSPAQASGVTYNPTTMSIVPGDVLSKTITVPVTVTGTNNKATFAITKVAPAGNALDTALNVAIVSVNGTNGATSATFTTSGTATVVVNITFPWGAAGDNNAAKTLSTTFNANYTLTQIPVATP
jgi:alternate signal-mediated exported protein